MLNSSEISGIIIESIQAAALASSTHKAGQRGGQGGYNTLTGVIFTEGQLYRHFVNLLGPERVIIAPRTAILQAFLGYWPYRNGLNVDKAVLAALQANHALLCKPRGLLSTTDKRDAYLTSIYLPGLTIGIDPGATLAASTWVLQRDGVPLAAGKCDALLT